MTPRERLMAALTGTAVDRVPIWLLFPYHPLGCYVNVMEHPTYRPVADLAKTHCVTLNRRHLNAGPLFKPAVSVRHSSHSDGDTSEHRTVLEYKGRQLQAWTRETAGKTEVRRLLESDEDLEFYASLPLETERGAIEAALAPELPRQQRETAEFPAHYGAMMLDLGEPIGVLYHNAKLEEFAIWSLTHADLVSRLLDQLMVRFRVIYEWATRHRLADVYFNVGSELAAPPLVSMETFRRWVIPYAQELIGVIHAGGAKSIQHFHGQVRDLLPAFVEMGADALHTIEAPPVGNCTLTEAFQAVGDRLTLIGNIQYDDFRFFTPEQMRAAVQSVLAEARGRRFILSPTAGPFDPDPPPQLIQNYLAFIEAGWDYGKAQS